MKQTFDLQNPWRKPGYRFPVGPCIERDLLRNLPADMDRPHVAVLIGSRQVGKTFLIRKIIETLIAAGKTDPKQIFYFNLDAFELVELVERQHDFVAFLDRYGVTGKKAYVFWDEAQRIPEAGLLAKRLHDLGLNLKLVVSGSSSLHIKSQVKESLAGRKRVYELYPITWSEFLSFNGMERPADLAAAARFEADAYQRLLEEFVRYGGYPGVVCEKLPREKTRLLSEIYRSYVQKDISDFLKIDDVGGFNRMVQFLAAQSGGLCKRNEVAKNVRLSRHYVDKYLQALQDTYVAALLKPHFPNLGKALVKTAKFYFCDTGLRNAVFGAFDPLDRRTDGGLLLESFVFSELLKHVRQDRLWFYRTSTGSEIDFLFTRGGRVFPIEVKFSLAGQRKIPKIFQTVAPRLGHRRALVVTRDYLGERSGSGLDVMFRPAWSLFDMGGFLEEWLRNG